MKFKIDENLPVEIAAALREAGHDAMTVVEQGLGGRVDARIAEVCRGETRALVTLDLDFSNVQAYPPRDYAGLVVLRVTRQDKPHVLAVFAKVVPLLTEEQLAQRLWIVDEGRVRIRT
jgi:predicted nuclease of predicted toxin-antitoxin system